MTFKVVSEFVPTGDQPEAIAALAEGIEEGQHYQTLLGVTGSGKTFTMAKLVEQKNSPDFRALLDSLYSDEKVLKQLADSVEAKDKQ